MYVGGQAVALQHTFPCKKIPNSIACNFGAFHQNRFKLSQFTNVGALFKY
jgi:hypothetical protein